MSGAAEDPRLAPGIALLGRTGALSFAIRYQDDEEPTVWLAIASYNVKNGRPAPEGTPYWEVDAGHDPTEAVLRLCARMIDGGQCAHCHRPSGFHDDITAPTNTVLDQALCWYQWDPELATFRRGCEGNTE